MNPSNSPDSPEEFQKELFELIKRIVPNDGLRFNVYVPSIDLNLEVSSDEPTEVMTEAYARELWAIDPMHPSRFDDTDVIVLSNSMLMTDSAWIKSEIYEKFYRPNNMFHNVDVFFRRNERIFAVLSLVRAAKENSFTEREIHRLEVIQPFIQFTLNKIYLPKRIHDRTTLSEEFELTPRELDVIELALTGASNKVLVEHLKVSQPTLRTHLQNIYAKIGVHSHSELISKVLGILK